MCGGSGGHRALIAFLYDFAALAHTTSMLCAEPQQVCPRRFGLNYDPPAIILEYLEVCCHETCLKTDLVETPGNTSSCFPFAPGQNRQAIPPQGVSRCLSNGV